MKHRSIKALRGRRLKGLSERGGQSGCCRLARREARDGGCKALAGSSGARQRPLSPSTAWLHPRVSREMRTGPSLPATLRNAARASPLCRGRQGNTHPRWRRACRQAPDSSVLIWALRCCCPFLQSAPLPGPAAGRHHGPGGCRSARCGPGAWGRRKAALTQSCGVVRCSWWWRRCRGRKTVGGGALGGGVVLRTPTSGVARTLRASWPRHGSRPRPGKRLDAQGAAAPKTTKAEENEHKGEPMLCRRGGTGGLPGARQQLSSTHLALGQGQRKGDFEGCPKGPLDCLEGPPRSPSGCPVGSRAVPQLTFFCAALQFIFRNCALFCLSISAHGCYPEACLFLFSSIWIPTLIPSIKDLQNVGFHD